MGLPALLLELQQKSEEGMARQIQYIMKQLDKEDGSEEEEEGQSDDEEEPTGNDDAAEEEYSDHDELEIDKDIVTRGIPTGETLLLSEFGINVTEDQTRRSKDYDSSSQLPIVETEKESDKEEEKTIEKKGKN